MTKNNDNRNGDLKESLSAAFKEIEKRSRTGLSGIESGFPLLDRITDGWQRGELYIIAARPSMGKTSLALSFAYNAAIDFNRHILCMTLETTVERIVLRLVSIGSDIPSDKIKKGTLDEKEWIQLIEITDKIADANLSIDDSHTLSVSDLRTKALSFAEKNPIELLIIDYVQLLSGEKDSQYSNREQEISFISRSLKSLAKELNIPIIAISQLSRSVESRGGTKRPYLSDLRDSGALEDDADMVMFIYRPEYYRIDFNEDNEPTRGLAELIIAKNRNGGLDTIRLGFKENLGKFNEFVSEPFAIANGSVTEYGRGSNRIIIGSRMHDMKDDDMPF